MNLVCFQGVDKESWSQLNALVKKGDWGRVLIVKHGAAESLDLSEKCEIISVDCNKSLLDLKEDVFVKLKEKLGKELEVGLSIASGNGKEHMALISALLNVPVGIKFVAFTKEGIEFVN